MTKIKDSKNTPELLSEMLAGAVSALRCGEGIVLRIASGERLCLYPAEFLEAKERFGDTKNAVNDSKNVINNTKNASNDTKSDNKIAISLAKRAGLLPILAVIPDSNATRNWPEFAENELETALNAAPKLLETARAKLPIAGAEDSELVSFRALGDDMVHLALIIGKPQNKEQIPLVRVHSSCVTGDLLGSLRCDCGDQLKLAISAIKSAGYGILLYLNQEGRGIGITNKIRSYALQEQGLDTYEANHELGFGSDERDFSIAKQILATLGINKIRLFSNNPHKVAELAKHGIEIVERVPLLATAHTHNLGYLTAKAEKAGHILSSEQ